MGAGSSPRRKRGECAGRPGWWGCVYGAVPPPRTQRGQGTAGSSRAGGLGHSQPLRSQGWDLRGRSPEWWRGAAVGLAGAGLTLPRTPYGSCRRSGCTAAAGPLDCSPSYRAPKRQEKLFCTGSPLAKVAATLTGAQWPTRKPAGRAGCAVGSTRTLSGPHTLACRTGAPALTWSRWCVEGALPGGPTTDPGGKLPQGGGQWEKKGPQCALKSRRPQAWTPGPVSLPSASESLPRERSGERRQRRGATNGPAAPTSRSEAWTRAWLQGRARVRASGGQRACVTPGPGGDQLSLLS